MEKYTEKLANFCVNLEYETIPKKVIEIIKWCILDNMGIIVGATKTDFGKAIIKYIRSLGDREEATILGSGLRSSARNAAFVNGSLSETLELQDGYSKGGYHPCCGTISASLAISEWQNITGRDLITAVIAGYEVGNRVSESIFPSHLARGFLPTGTAGTIGAAAATAKLYGLKAEQFANALGIAAFTFPVTSWDCQFGGYSIKPVQGGAAARTGIEAALLARLGLTAAPLEGDPKIRKGSLRMVSDEVKLVTLIQGLGEVYTVENLYFKPYALCRMSHGPVEIAVDLRQKYGIKYEEIQQVTVRTYDFAANMIGKIRTSPTSDPILCQFSMPYGVAAALMFGEVGLEQMMGDVTRDPKIHDLAGKIDVVHDKEMDKLRPANRPSAVEVTLKDDRKFSGYVDYPRGDSRKPMTDEELITKFSGLTTGIIGEGNVKKAIDMIFSLEKLESVKTLAECLQ